jgi:hypothetical protein
MRQHGRCSAEPATGSASNRAPSACSPALPERGQIAINAITRRPPD